MATQKVIAAHLDLDQSSVSRLLADLGLDAKTASLESIRVAYLRKLRAVAAGHRSHDGMDLTHERVLTERVDRELKSLALAEKRGQLVNVEQIEPELALMAMAFRTELLARDDRLKADLDALHGIDIDLQVLTAHTRDALHQLARYDPERAGAVAPAGGDAGAAARDDDDRVGPRSPSPLPENHSQAGPLQP